MNRRLRLLSLASTQLAIIAGCLIWYFAPWAAGRVQPIEVARIYRDSPQQRDNEFHLWPGNYAGFTEYYRRGWAKSGDEMQLSRPVDFNREKLVRVTWSDTGPLNAKIEGRTCWGGRRVDFFIDEPPATYATFVKIYFENWFTVPRDAKVRFAGRESMPSSAWSLFALSGAATLGIAVSLKRRAGLAGG